MKVPERPVALTVPASSAPPLGRVPFPDLVREIIRRLGDDPSREGLLRTPERVEEALGFLTRGYTMSPREIVEDALFEERHHNMVIVKNIEMYSLCEHHLLPFFGKVHVAYIPDGRILGLSKIARLVEVFARRLQVQERLTEQIAESLWEVVEPQGVGVVIEAYHLCMMMRGVQKQNSYTITSAVRGAFLDDARTRDEFLRLCQSENHPLG
ncbi:MAG: GTP cyclohydrolase I FolE [Gemmatimonadetes bacterium]|nr:GTP cyclohydrolase I FolE [Gemmatimonadota bacterium]